MGTNYTTLNEGAVTMPAVLIRPLPPGVRGSVIVTPLYRWMQVTEFHLVLAGYYVYSVFASPAEIRGLLNRGYDQLYVQYNEKEMEKYGFLRHSFHLMMDPERVGFHKTCGRKDVLALRSVTR